jgi:hypothetical protein
VCFGKEAESVLFGAVFDNVPVQEEQVGSGRFLEGPIKFRGLGEDGDSEPVFEDTFDVIEDCGVAIENDDVRAALTRSLEGHPLFRA